MAKRRVSFVSRLRIECLFLGRYFRLTPFALFYKQQKKTVVRYPPGREESERARSEHELLQRSPLAQAVFRVCHRPRLETRGKPADGNEGSGFGRVRGEVEAVSRVGVVVRVFRGVTVSPGEERVCG